MNFNLIFFLVFPVIESVSEWVCVFLCVCFCAWVYDRIKLTLACSTVSSSFSLKQEQFHLIRNGSKTWMIKDETHSWYFLFFFLWHLVTDATVLLNINTTVAESTVLPCSLSTTTPVFTSSLRFYWQDDRDYVLYSFNKGKEMPEHVKDLYRERITAFQQDMIRGNISVKVKNTTLEDNLRVFRAFADNRGPGTDSHVIGQTCQMTLHVSGKDGINAELSCAKPAAASYYKATSIRMQIFLKTDMKKRKSCPHQRCL